MFYCAFCQLFPEERNSMIKLDFTHKISIRLEGFILADTVVYEKIRELLCDQLDLENDEVTMDAKILDDLDADSLDLHDLRGSIEEEFDVTIHDEDVENIITVEELVQYVESHM